jgi:hypothetical protein
VRVCALADQRDPRELPQSGGSLGSCAWSVEVLRFGRRVENRPIPNWRNQSMSHILTIQTKLHDPAAVAAACQRLNLPAPVDGTATLFSGDATGLLIKLPNWVYPLVVNTTTGQAAFDNYQGAWGDQEHLDRFLQMYAVEKTKLEARKKGYSVSEHALNDGSIKLQVIESS